VPIGATSYVEDGDLIDLGDRQLSIVLLPGHAPGSIGLWDEANDKKATKCAQRTIYFGLAL
jgi:glyoxylase-like metal-dependent hydrolase (beta-lactamase superfamily II)